MEHNITEHLRFVDKIQPICEDIKLDAEEKQSALLHSTYILLEALKVFLIDEEFVASWHIYRKLKSPLYDITVEEYCSQAILRDLDNLFSPFDKKGE